MPPLLHDRYLMIDAHHARDLATGEVVPAGGLPERDGPVLPPLTVLTDVLAHGQDGRPRAVVVDLPAPGGWTEAARRVALEATRHGYVPVMAQIYPKLRLVMPEDLD